MKLFHAQTYLWFNHWPFQFIFLDMPMILCNSEPLFEKNEKIE